MSEAERKIKPETQTACDIAAGRAAADPGGAGIECVGAKRDFNARGNGPEYYRMVYRSGGWRYVSDERLPRGTFLASDRRATVYGDVYPGELVVSHPRGGSITDCWLVREKDDEDKFLVRCEYRSRRDGQLSITLPDGVEVVVPNPRAK